MEILSTQYEIKPFGGFKQVKIYESNGNFSIGLFSDSTQVAYIVFKDVVVGALGYLANKKSIDKAVVYFDSFESCVKYLYGLTDSKFVKKFKEGKVEDIGFLISIKD